MVSVRWHGETAAVTVSCTRKKQATIPCCREEGRIDSCGPGDQHFLGKDALIILSAYHLLALLSRSSLLSLLTTPMPIALNRGLICFSLKYSRNARQSKAPSNR